jgi:predicted nucleotidyltransferase component of viral defense system
MIPMAQIIQWRNQAPWPDDMQVEQDLILSRVLIDIFSDPFLNQELAFRGGTALHKLFFKPAARYSEDIDLVRTSTGAIKDIILRLQSRLDPWLGKPKTSYSKSNFKLCYYFNPEASPSTRLRVKIEINTREHFTAYGRSLKDFSVQSDWFSGQTKITTYAFEELIATKLRALYQRRKGRDAFDLWLALQQENFNIEKAILAFNHYVDREKNRITRVLFEKNLADKLENQSFLDDIGPLLSPNLKSSYETWSMSNAVALIKHKFLIHLS